MGRTSPVRAALASGNGTVLTRTVGRHAVSSLQANHTHGPHSLYLWIILVLRVHYSVEVIVIDGSLVARESGYTVNTLYCIVVLCLIENAE